MANGGGCEESPERQAYLQRLQEREKRLGALDPRCQWDKYEAEVTLEVLDYRLQWSKLIADDQRDLIQLEQWEDRNA